MDAGVAPSGWGGGGGGWEALGGECSGINAAAKVGILV